VVDHKTGKTFYEQDDLQLTLYREFVRQRFGAEKCTAFFDKYRWVNNLDRIRKPAMEREQAKLKKGDLARAQKRVAKADEKMRRIEAQQSGSANGECFKCPFKSQCPKARTGWY